MRTWFRTAGLACVLLVASDPPSALAPQVSQEPQTASISGRVIDADTGAPLEGVSVGSRDIGWSSTDADGIYSIQALKAGRYSIWIRGNYIASAEAPPVI